MILDNIDIQKVQEYFGIDSESSVSNSNTDVSGQSILSFLEWAYDKDYLTFQKYQQIKDVIDNPNDYELSQQEIARTIQKVRLKTPTNSVAKVEKEENNFFISYAYIFLPLLTLIFLGLAYFAFYPSNDTLIKGEFSYDNTNNIQKAHSISPQGTSLTFEGQVTNSSGIPIKESTNVRFRLYDASEGGNVLYDSANTGDCVVDPIVNGTIKVDLGKTCGAPFPDTIFQNGSNIWLGLQVDTDPEMQPRKKVVSGQGGLALGAFTGQNNISNEEGDLLKSDNFTVSSQKTLTLQSAGQGDVIVHASDSGHIRFLTGGSQAVDISNAGYVGINKDDPEYNLDILGNVNIDAGQLKVGSFSSNPPSIGDGSLYYNTDDKKIYYHDGDSWKLIGSEQNNLNITGTGEDNYAFATFRSDEGDVLGQIRKNDLGGISYETQGADFAEFFRKDLTTSYNHEDFSPGTLLCHSQNGVSPCDTSSKYIAGVLSDNPGFIGGANLSNSDDFTLVGLVGQLEIKAYNDGTIKQGDALSISTHPGYATKATDKGYIIGYAQETPSSTGFTTVKTHIQPSYFDPYTYTGKDNSTYLAQVSNSLSELIQAIKIETETLIANVIEGTTGIFDTLLAKNVETESLEASNILSESISATTLSASTVEADNIAELKDKVEAIADKTELELFDATDTDLTPLIASEDTYTSTGVFSPSIETNTTDAGASILPAEEKSILIYNENVKQTSLIYLTSTSPTQNRTLYVAEKRGCASQESAETDCRPYFKVSIDSPLEEDVSFNWWILQE